MPIPTQRIEFWSDVLGGIYNRRFIGAITINGTLAEAITYAAMNLPKNATRVTIDPVEDFPDPPLPPDEEC